MKKKAKLSVLYRGTINWNAMKVDTRNMSFKDFKLYQKKSLNTHYINELFKSSVFDT